MLLKLHTFIKKKLFKQKVCASHHIITEYIMQVLVKRTSYELPMNEIFYENNLFLLYF